ncbi:DUF1538 domain-containing protein [Desulforhopalus singaporensis]|uniref:DUF1538 domain-containing protein n=1 Tax=Desulforhopalus singaporensis TaxID=91360 RepID=A0A1H0RU61_9BACT|nr:DUF1538 domain-containing protein [Desulforhopalus singaporensis]SDP33111.1 Protein of unknown function [Desulforhopalus singaporensis]
MQIITDFASTLLATSRDLFPIALIFTFFQLVIIKEPVAGLPRILGGALYVFLGLALFLTGLEEALFPVGEIMAEQLTNPDFLQINGEIARLTDWKSYGWLYLFAAMIGFATTVAEPSLIAVAYKANEVSGGGISQWGLRLTVGIGVAFGITLGTFRIITGTPLHMYIMAGYIVVTLQTFFAPKSLIPLAYDSGGVTTSTVTVPIVAALGLQLSASVPGRNPAVDGFGLIAFASLFPIISVLAYAQAANWFATRKIPSRKEKDHAV